MLKIETKVTYFSSLESDVFYDVVGWEKKKVRGLKKLAKVIEQEKVKCKINDILKSQSKLMKFEKCCVNSAASSAARMTELRDAYNIFEKSGKAYYFCDYLPFFAEKSLDHFFEAPAGIDSDTESDTETETGSKIKIAKPFLDKQSVCFFLFLLAVATVIASAQFALLYYLGIPAKYGESSPTNSSESCEALLKDSVEYYLEFNQTLDKLGNCSEQLVSSSKQLSSCIEKVEAFDCRGQKEYLQYFDVHPNMTRS